MGRKMSAKKVIDASALLAFLENGQGAEKVSELIKHVCEKDRMLLISSLSWCEVCHAIFSSLDRAKAEAAIENLLTLPIEIAPFEQEDAKIVALIKAEHKTSYIDSAAVALAKKKKTALLTIKSELKKLDKIASVELL